MIKSKRFVNNIYSKCQSASLWMLTEWNFVPFMLPELLVCVPPVIFMNNRNLSYENRLLLLLKKSDKRDKGHVLWSARSCHGYLAWLNVSRHLLSWLRSTAPPTARAAKSSALWFLDRGGRTIRAGKHKLLLSSTASPFTGLHFQLKTLKMKKNNKKVEGGMQDLAVGGNQAAFGVHTNINSQVDKSRERGADVRTSFWCENSSSSLPGQSLNWGRWGRGLPQQWSRKFSPWVSAPVICLGQTTSVCFS